MNKSHTYFENLNYTMSNEDTSLEYEVLDMNKNQVVTIASSGSRVLPLFAKNPKNISICDFSKEQLALTMTRVESVKLLNYEDFLAFWGYPGPKKLFNSQRKKIFYHMQIDDEYKQIMESIFNSNQWEPLIYYGKYEKTLIRYNSILTRLFGKKHIKKLKSFKKHSEFKNYLESEFPKHKWKTLVFILGSAPVLNKLLYQGQLPKKNLNISHYKYFKNIFDNLFSIYTPRESFFLQMIFFGRLIDMKGAPIETDKKLFSKMKEGISNSNISYHHGELFNSIKAIDNPIDFISFSDILSYFPADLENIYLQKIYGKLNTNAITVHRYYLNVHKNLDTTGFTKETHKYSKMISNENTQIYYIDIYKKDTHEKFS